MRRWVLVLAVVALAVTVGVWAQNMPAQSAQTNQPAQAQQPTEVTPPAQQPAPATPQTGQVCAPMPLAQAVQMKQAGNATLASEHTRCVATCATVIPYYQQKYTTLQTHEGDSQCWNNCWAQFGDRTRTEVSLTDKKQLWSTKSAQYLRVNQCAQTCWRKFNPQQTAVNVSGFSSTPRPIVAATMQASNQVFSGQATQIVTAPTSATAP